MPNINYDRVLTYTKRDTLSQWYCSFCGQPKKRESYYSEPRDIQLILLIRYENNKIYAKIKCPINPLPVRGEFEAPSLTAITDFLVNNDWTLKEDMNLHMFK